MNIRHGLFGFMLLPTLVSAASVEVVSSSVRDFGYVIGDLIEHRFTLIAPRNLVLEDRYLPQPGPLEEALELRQINWQASEEANTIRYDFRLNYQLFKGVRVPERFDLPRFTVHFAGTAPTQIDSPSAYVTVNPLIAPGLNDEQVVIRNLTPLPEPTPVPSHRFLLWGLGLLLALAALGYRVTRSWRRSTPFDALLSAWSPSNTNDAGGLDRLRQLHEAFNHTAGHTVLRSGLDDFLLAHPGYQVLETEIRWFFACSEQAFFGSATGEKVWTETDTARLWQLCRNCARIARRAA